MKEIPLSQGLVALVDDEDYEVVAAHRWHAVRPGIGTLYAQRNVPGPGGRSREYLHRLLVPGAEMVDHRNGDGLDNRRANLRVATRQQNGANQRLSAANRSGYKGVSWHRHRGRWRAVIKADQRQRFLGYFDDPVDAALAYDDAARVLFGEFAALNFPTADEVSA